MRYSLDFETKSTVDLVTCGSYIYATHPSTSILCACLFEDAEKKMYVYDSRREDNSEFLEVIKDIAIFNCWNAEFEYYIWKYVAIRIGWVHKKMENFKCTQALALSLNLPARLGHCAEALGTEHQKDKEGTRLLKKFSKVEKEEYHSLFDASSMDTDFDKLIEYCKTDTLTEASVLNALPSNVLMGKEQRVFYHTLALNEKGVKIDVEYANALNTYYKFKKDVEYLPAFLEIARKYDNSIYSPNQSLKIKSIVEKCLCIELTSIDKDTIMALLENCKNEDIKELLTIKLLLSASSLTKLNRISDMSDKDGRIHNILKYHKASTGRFSGTGIQLHNLPRNSGDKEELKTIRKKLINGSYEEKGNFADTVKNLLRSIIVPEENNVFIIADFSSIENRVMAWLSKDKESLDMFEDGRDQYKDMASVIYKVDYDKVTTEQRKEAKTVVLGCQYGMGSKKFAENTGLDLDVSVKLVRSFRKRYKKLVDMWADIYSVAMDSINTPYKVFWYRNLLMFTTHKDYLIVGLPSGRCIAFPFVSIVETDYGYDSIAFKTMKYIDVTGKDKKANMFSDEWMSAPLLSQNITQAVARDILVDTMFNLEKNNFPISFHVHDEVICEVSKIRLKDKLKMFNKIVVEKSNWYKGIPIEIEGEIHANFGKI